MKACKEGKECDEETEKIREKIRNYVRETPECDPS